jgi:DNA-binding CsgD family transcriptional regulator
VPPRRSSNGFGVAQHSELQERTEPLRRALQAELDDITLHRELGIGKGMSVPAAIALAAEIARVRSETPSSAAPALTARQREILQLLTGGRSNAAIAAKLIISKRTVTTHLTHIYDRLGVGSRGEAIARAHQLGIVPPGSDT